MATVVGVVWLVKAITSDQASVNSWLFVFGMAFVVIGQVLSLRKQGKPPTR